MMYFYFFVALFALIIVVGVITIKVVNHFKPKYQFEAHGSYMVLEYTNDIIELAKENAWEWLLTPGLHNIDITQISKLTSNILTDITVRSFYDKIYTSDDTLKYISDDEVYDIIKNIIDKNYHMVMEFCRTKSREIDKLENADITKSESKKENYNTSNDSVLDAINLFYSDNNTDNDV